MKCVDTNATNYDILVGQQALYPLGFGLDNWTEEDGRLEMVVWR
jgi:hypothetical protein